MENQILDFVLSNTNIENLTEVSTKQVATKFGIETKKAYNILMKLAKEKKITHLDPVNGQKFDCAGWIEPGDVNEL